MNTPKKDHKSLPDGTLVAIRYPYSPEHDRIVVVRGGDLYGPSDYSQRHPHQWGNYHSDHYLSLRVIDLPPADPDAELVEKMARAAYERSGFSWGNLTDRGRASVCADARAALAVVREHEAKS